MAHEDLTGQKFNQLTAVRYISRAVKAKTALWEWRCSCGNTKIIQANNVKNGHTKSCGCYQEKNRGLYSITHGKSSSAIYYIWATMKARCHNPRHDKFPYYGKRDISVCDRWKNSFHNFLADMGEPPSNGMQIDRIDNNKGYEPGNCRWVTKSVNMRNKRNNHLVVYKGRSIPIVQLAEELNLPAHLFYRRITQWGMSVEEAIESAKNRRKPHGKKASGNAKKSN